MTKRVWIGCLIGLNAALLLALLASLSGLPAAWAQEGVAAGSDYSLVAGQVDVSNEALYLIDHGRQKVHAFRMVLPPLANEPVRIGYAGTRDLVPDFRRPDPQQEKR